MVDPQDREALLQLKELRDQGLIDEDVYKESQQKIMNRMCLENIARVRYYIASFSFLVSPQCCFLVYIFLTAFALHRTKGTPASAHMIHDVDEAASSSFKSIFKFILITFICFGTLKLWSPKHKVNNSCHRNNLSKGPC